MLVPAVGVGIFCSAGGFFDSFKGSDIGLGGGMSLEMLVPYLSRETPYYFEIEREKGVSSAYKTRLVVSI